MIIMIIYIYIYIIIMYYILHIVLITCKTLVRPWWKKIMKSPHWAKPLPSLWLSEHPSQDLRHFPSSRAWQPLASGVTHQVPDHIFMAYDQNMVQTYIVHLYPYLKHIPMTNITRYYNILHNSNICFYKSCNPTILWIEQEASITCWLSHLLKCGSHWGYHPISLVE